MFLAILAHKNQKNKEAIALFDQRFSEMKEFRENLPEDDDERLDVDKKEVLEEEALVEESNRNSTVMTHQTNHE